MSEAAPENWIDIPGVGALLGMAVGDALGTTYEFQGIDQPDYPTLATGPATGLVGAGPFALEPGQVTDDTQMAVCLARSLADKRTIDMVDIATRYVAWFQHAFDVGNQTRAALRAIEQGESVGSAARRVWHGSGRRAAGNGSLMRTAPIGVFYARANLEKLVEAAVSDSLITHADPRCVIACAALNAAIARGVVVTGAGSRMASGSGASAPVTDGIAAAQSQVHAARAAIPIAAGKLRELYDDNRDDLAMIDAAVEDLERDLDICASENPGVYRVDLDMRRNAGFVRVAFRLAFWHVLHTPTWRAAVVDVASRGGDADTNAAIVGALLGARDGVAMIPRDWIGRVLAVKQPGPEDWAEAIHPKHLVAFARAVG